MRVKGLETVRAPCFNMMEKKDVNGASSPVTEIKYSPSRSDAVNSNGLLSPPTTPSAVTPVDNEYTPPTSGSGRFKFFKDGKFILELWHHKNGERMFWVPVSKNNTYWPSVGNCTSRQESSTSLSDDNISVQSSPWQRDHSWKQNTPKKNISHELEFAMHLSRPRKVYVSSSLIRKKRRRRPYEAIKVPTESKLKRCKKVVVACKEKSSSGSGDRSKRVEEYVQKLWARRASESVSVSVSHCRTDPGIISPRKRILKEMEKVTLEEQFGNTSKKYRTKQSSTSSSSTSSSSSSSSVNCSSPNASSSIGSASTCITVSIAKPISSHSINSILARDEEQQPSFLRNLLRSPSTENGSSRECNSRNAFRTAESPSSSDTSPPTVVVRSLASNQAAAHCSTPVTALSPTTTTAQYPSSSASIQFPQPIPATAYFSSPYLYHPAAVTATPFLTSPPISNHPPYYHTPFAAAAGYHNASALWGLRSVSSLPRPSLYPLSAISSYPTLTPSPWVPLAHSSFHNYNAIATPGTDVPLNLSKHPG